eukprot:GHVU01177379.1.p1 GENE.GHVU01177379.1~~GHVU01177379.1.p1  ORF type:complete len:212 (+),score=37.01 GHVU01177379.1:84-638(+)
MAYEQDFGEFISPEEMFAAFFGHDITGGRIHRRVRRTPPTAQQQRVFNVMQMLPLFILFAITLLSNWFSQPPRRNFDLVPSGAFPVRRATREEGISYFVDESFDTKFPQGSPKLRELEGAVELQHLQSACGREESTVARKLQYERFYGKHPNAREFRKRLAEIESTPRPNCQKLQARRMAQGYL